MTKELEETKAAGEEVAKWLRDEAKNAEVLADHFHGTSEEDRFREDFARYSAMAATVRTLLSALSRGDGPPEGWVLVPKIPTTEQRRKNAARVAIMLRAVTGKDFAGWDFADDLYDQFVRGAPKLITPNTLRDNGLSVETSPELITCPGVGWRPMTTVRDARDGRHVLLKPVKTRAAALIVDGGVIGHWVSDEREWFVAINAKDLMSASGWGLIDDDFEGWKPLPDKSLSAMIAAAPPVPEGEE